MLWSTNSGAPSLINTPDCSKFGLVNCEFKSAPSIYTKMIKLHTLSTIKNLSSDNKHNYYINKENQIIKQLLIYQYSNNKKLQNLFKKITQ
jgi:hypothetical protein